MKEPSFREKNFTTQKDSSHWVLGIDEAGRGPILGPMVLACVVLDQEASGLLLGHGVMDSKRFGAGPSANEKRQALVPFIIKHAIHTDISIVEVEEIDKRTYLGELNKLEQEKATELIQKAPKVDLILADGARLFSPLEKTFSELRAVNRAESLHVAVAAASILAKVKRDELWHEIVKRYKKEFGQLVGPGGGYANPETKRFLRAYCAKYHHLPDEGRRSWPWDFVSDLLDPEEYRGLIERLIGKKYSSEI